MGMVSLGFFIWALSWNFENTIMENVIYHFILWLNLLSAIVNINLGMKK